MLVHERTVNQISNVVITYVAPDLTVGDEEQDLNKFKAKVSQTDYFKRHP